MLLGTIVMKTYNHLFFRLGVGVLITFATSFLSLSADTTTSSAAATFKVKDGEFPWSDRVKVWQLAEVPTTLVGNDPLPQQSCASRGIVVPEGAKLIVFAVATSDVEKLKADFPDAKPTGETLSVTHADGTNAIPYTVFKLASPPAKVGDPAFGAGVILLKTSSDSA